MCMCVRVLVYKLVCEGLLGWGFVNDDDCGFSRNFRLCLAANKRECTYISERETDKRQTDTERERRHREMYCDSRFLLLNRSLTRS